MKKKYFFAECLYERTMHHSDGFELIEKINNNYSLVRPTRSYMFIILNTLFFASRLCQCALRFYHTYSTLSKSKQLPINFF